jgi:hypothetical protein
MNVVKKMTVSFLRTDKGLSLFLILISGVLLVGYPYAVLRGFLFFLIREGLRVLCLVFSIPGKGRPIFGDYWASSPAIYVAILT